MLTWCQLFEMCITFEIELYNLHRIVKEKIGIVQKCWHGHNSIELMEM